MSLGLHSGVKPTQTDNYYCRSEKAATVATEWVCGQAITRGKGVVTTKGDLERAATT